MLQSRRNCVAVSTLFDRNSDTILPQFCPELDAILLQSIAAIQSRFGCDPAAIAKSQFGRNLVAIEFDRNLAAIGL